MSNSYKTIHWGLLILAFNFYLGRVNILPDFLAFILISNGLNKLNIEEMYFYKGKVLARFMGTITLIQYIVDIFTGYSTSNMTIEGVGYFFINNILNIVTLAIIYYILKGIYFEAEKQGLTDFMYNIKNRWNFKFLISVTMMLLSPFIINDGDFILMAMPIVLIMAIIAQIMVAFVVKRASIELN